MAEFFGVGAFRITVGATTYNPTGWYKVFPKLKTKILKAYSVWTGTLNVKTVEKYMTWEIKKTDISESDWENVFSQIDGVTFTFIPHIDRPLLTYQCYASGVETNFSKKRDYYEDDAVVRIIQINSLGGE